MLPCVASSTNKPLELWHSIPTVYGLATSPAEFKGLRSKQTEAIETFSFSFLRMTLVQNESLRSIFPQLRRLDVLRLKDC